MKKAWKFAPFAALLLALAGGAQAGLVDPALEAKKAIDAKAVERAATILIAAAGKEPGNPVYPFMLGSLYDEAEFFDLAFAQYEKAAGLGMGGAELYRKLALVAGKVNQEAASVFYYKKYLEEEPGDRDAMGDLAWMYFKVHRLKEGIDLLEGEGEKAGFGRGFDMTLGTLYSELYEYPKSKGYYQRAIEESFATGDDNFAAVALYNLSLLEYSFRRFDESFRLSIESIAARDRASGHLAKGELLAEKLDLGGAAGEFNLAMDKDQTPLSKLSLAEAYRRAGRLDEALRIATEVLAIKDNAWMLNYGIDLSSHQLSIYGLLEEIHEGLATRARSRASFEAFAGIGSWVAALREEGLAAYYAALRRKAGWQVAKSYLDQGNSLSANQRFAEAFDDYPSVALPYLMAAMDFEEGKVPGAKYRYLAEQGRLLGDRGILDQAIAGFDPAWERFERAEALAEAARLAGGAGDRAGEEAYVEELYAMLKSAPRLKGLALPVSLSIDFPEGASDSLKAWLSGLLRKGLEASGFRIAGEGRRYSLSIKVGRVSVEFSLTDAGNPRWSGSYADKKEAFAWAEGICAAVQSKAFTIDF